MPVVDIEPDQKLTPAQSARVEPYIQRIEEAARRAERKRREASLKTEPSARTRKAPAEKSAAVLRLDEMFRRVRRKRKEQGLE
jgi:hypothetical protein